MSTRREKFYDANFLGWFRNEPRPDGPADLTPPAPLSSSALLRNAAWRGGSQKRSSFRLPPLHERRSREAGEGGRGHRR